MEREKLINLITNRIYTRRIYAEGLADDILSLIRIDLQKEYERGIEDGKTIAKHGTTNWID